MDRFIQTVWRYYEENKRAMPWRDDTRPYYIVVSEIMLQQTQVDRVVKRFESFTERFPDWKALARASTHEVLSEWSGLGYNRRALYLKKIAETVMTDPEYAFLNEPAPRRTHPLRKSSEARRRRETGADSAESDAGSSEGASLAGHLYRKLFALPGIGPNTAGSIIAFAFNIPYPFIETNIRSVFIHFFFRKSHGKITDARLFPFIEKALTHPRNQKNPREWYYALMDYGAYLKKTLPNPSRRSAHHMKQSPFKGSNREQRSRIVRVIMEKPVKIEKILEHFAGEEIDPEKIRKNISDLIREGFITKQKNEKFDVPRN